MTKSLSFINFFGFEVISAVLVDFAVFVKHADVLERLYGFGAFGQDDARIGVLVVLRDDAAEQIHQDAARIHIRESVADVQVKIVIIRVGGIGSLFFDISRHFAVETVIIPAVRLHDLSAVSCRLRLADLALDLLNMDALAVGGAEIIVALVADRDGGDFVRLRVEQRGSSCC